MRGWRLVALTATVTPVLLVPGMVPVDLRAWLPPVLAGVAVGAAALAPRLDAGIRVLVAALGIALALGWAQAPVEADAVAHLCGAAAGLLLMATIATWATTRRRLAAALFGIVVVGVVALGVGLRSSTAPGFKGLPVVLSQISNPPELPGAWALGQPFVNPNALSIAAVMVLCLGGVAAFARRPPRTWRMALRLAGLGGGLAAVVVLASAQSRGAVLAVGVTAACAQAAVRRGIVGPSRWRITAVVTIAVTVAGLLIWSDGAVRESIRASAGERVERWTTALRFIQTHPWSGIGLDAYRVMAPRQVHAHNIVLQTALDIGLPGLVVYLVFVGLLLRRAVRVWHGPTDPFVRAVAAGGGLALVAVHAYGLLDAVALGTKIGTLQWVAAGLVLASDATARKEPE